MPDYILNQRALDLIGLKAQNTKHCSQNRSSNSHTNFIAKGDKGILKSVISNTSFPFSVLYAIRNNGINRSVESAEEQLGKSR